MTAAAWQYIGSQGILQGTWQSFSSAADIYFGGSLAGRTILTCGCGGMGGAQPLAGQDGRRGDAGGRSQSGPAAQTHRHRVSRPHDGIDRRGARLDGRAAGRRRRRFGGARRQRCRRLRRTPQAQVAARHPHRPVHGRSAQGLRGRGAHRGADGGAGQVRSRCRACPRQRDAVAPCRRDARISRPRRPHFRVRQYLAHARGRPRPQGSADARVVRDALHPAALLRGHRAVPLDRRFRGRQGHRASWTD